MKILRITEVKLATGHRSHASIYEAIKAGLFTKPVSIGLRSVGWPEVEVFAINAARIAGHTTEQLQQFVSYLEGQRQHALLPYCSKEAA